MKDSNTLWTIALTAALFSGGMNGAATSASAEDPPEPHNWVGFSVSREAQAENDRATAIVAVTDEDDDAAELAKRVNETMSWALGEAKSVSEVSLRSGGYRTFPISHDGRIRRWRARQELVLESGDVEALTRLLGRLQTRVELASIDFSVAPETRRRVEDELISQVLSAFRARAELIRQGLGASSFELIDLQLDTDGRRGPDPYASRAMARAERAAPAIEAGTSRVSVTASGTIALD